MIRREGDSLILEGPVTLDTVPGLIGAAEEHLGQGARVADFRNVTEVDSAAVALALEWLRRAAENRPGCASPTYPLRCRTRQALRSFRAASVGFELILRAGDRAW